MKITAFPNKYAKGWDGKDTETKISGVVVDLHDAMDETYATDAHFAPYYIKGEEKSYRLRKGEYVDLETGQVNDTKKTVLFDVLVADIDGENHKADAVWREDQLNKLDACTLGETAGWYATKGGLRFLWRLPQPLPPAAYLEQLSELRKELSKIGVECDPLKDWTRLYRLPHVKRDGKAQTLPKDLSWMDEGTLSFATPKNPQVSRFSGIKDVKGDGSKPLPTDITKNRNNTLFALAGTLRDKGLEYTEILHALRGINEGRCKPPLSDDEVEKIAKSITRYAAGAVVGQQTTEDGESEESPDVRFVLGSENEIADHTCDELERSKKDQTTLIFAQQILWEYLDTKGIWEEVNSGRIYATVMGYDGEGILTTGANGKQRVVPLRVSNKLTENIEKLIHKKRHTKGFFNEASDGIAFADKFVSVNSDGLQFLPHSPEHRQTTCLPYAFQEKAMPSMFISMLRDIWEDCDDCADRIELLREWIGAALTGRATRYAKGLILVGDGANGKSTVQQIVTALFPPKNVTAVAPQDFDQEYRRAMLARARLNVVAELPETEILAAEAVKAMITGDVVVARQIRQAPFEYEPKAAHLFSANALPGVRDMSRGFWRRWIVVDFPREFSEAEQDRTLARRVIAKELPAIASWVLEGAATLASRGHYPIPESSEKALKDWRQGADQVALFLEDRKDDNADGYTSASRLYQHYTNWVKQTGHSALSQHRFGKRLKACGIDKKRTNRGAEYALILLPILRAVPAMPKAVGD